MTMMVAAQETASASGLDWQTLLATVVYALLGFALLMLFAWVVNAVFRLDLRRELIEDQNTGLGLAIAGAAVAIAIIIAATIVG
ncbi:MAG: DUF350 domain-containing protein [Actinomyces sp.]|uniref:DUF350 domain-containing protein n=1 Tax=Actinomyces sp. TaxID=29317 RepID=UPI0026DB8352|nr:DUF350 domain-containing protein [Actinomyces sp.]MDO4242991.1 DUF350 domain-containing protein [Actinomyces sp.]